MSHDPTTLAIECETLPVLHVRTVVGSGGGADKTTLRSPSYLEGSRYLASVAYLYPPGDPGFQEIRAKAQMWSCSLEALPDRGLLDLSILRRLYSLCRRLKVRIWHGHEYKSNLIGWMLRPFCGFRLITTVHGWVEHSPKLFLFYAVDRWVLRRYDRVIVVSQDLYDACAKDGVSRTRLRLIENAIESSDYTRCGPPAHAPGRVGNPSELLIGQIVPQERLVIGAVGRLSPEKGFDLLIEAVARLCARGLDVELWIAGEGPQEGVLKEQAKATDSGDRIRLIGFHSDVVGLFECFDILCLPSLREGLPNVVLEAMAMEVPIVATRSGGLEFALRDGIDVSLVEPGSVGALERGLEGLIQNAEQRLYLAQEARARVERDFSFRRRMDKVIAVYDELFSV